MIHNVIYPKKTCDFRLGPCITPRNPFSEAESQKTLRRKRPTSKAEAQQEPSITRFTLLHPDIKHARLDNIGTNRVEGL